MGKNLDPENRTTEKDCRICGAYMASQHEVHAEMVMGLTKPGGEIIAGLTADVMHLLHMAIGISGEVAEIVGALTRENLVEEFGDLLFYIEGILSKTGEMVPYDEPCRAVDETWMIVQAGKILDIVKKRVIYGKPLDTKALRAETLALREMAICNMDMSKISVAEVLEHNHKKLGKRYEGHKYSDKAAQERADKAEA